MSLAPLPTSEVTSLYQEQSHLPYPELRQNTSSEKKQPKKQKEKQQQQGHAEQQRLAELESMLSEAQSRTALVEQQAYDKAYAAGEKAGLALGEKRAEQILEVLEHMRSQVEQELLCLQQKSVEVVTEMAGVIIKKILDDDAQYMEKVLEKTIHQLLAHLDISGQSVVLCLNPRDLDMFRRMLEMPESVRIELDEHMAQGSCRILSKHHDTWIEPKAMVDKMVDRMQQQLLRLYNDAE